MIRREKYYASHSFVLNRKIIPTNRLRHSSELLKRFWMASMNTTAREAIPSNIYNMLDNYSPTDCPLYRRNMVHRAFVAAFDKMISEYNWG